MSQPYRPNFSSDNCSIGVCYDLRTEQPTELNILDYVSTTHGIMTEKNKACHYEYIADDTIQERMKKMNIPSDYMVSILCGLVNVKATGDYVRMDPPLSGTVRAYLAVTLTTVQESIDLSSSTTQSLIRSDVIQNPKNATHAVTGLQWGGRATCIFDYKLGENESYDEVQKALKLGIGTLKNNIDSNKSLDDKTFGLLDSSKIKLSFVGDCLPATQLTVANIVDLMRNVPSCICEKNDGKGVPIGHILTPLEKIAAIGNLPLSTNIVFKEIEDDVINQIISVMDEATKNIRQIQSIRDLMAKHEKFIEEDSCDEIGKFKKKAEADRKKFVQQLKCNIGAVRNNEVQALVSMKRLLGNIKKWKFGPSALEAFKQNNRELINYCCHLQQLQAKQVTIAKREDNLSDLLPESGVCYVFCYESQSPDDVENFSMMLEIFNIIASENGQIPTSYKCVAANMSIVDTDEVFVGNEIRVFENGTKTNVYKNTPTSALIPFVCPRIYMPKPSKQTLKCGDTLFANCPRFNALENPCCDEPKQWFCFDCQEKLMYTYDGHIVCKNCGSCALNECKFKCDFWNHGAKFVDWNYPKNDQKLPASDEDKEINVLLLGETGIGKTTLIDALTNYIKFATLKDALNNYKDVSVEIPTDFTISGGSKLDPKTGMKTKTNNFRVSVGKPDKNEAHNDGQSCTQDPMTYRFNWYGKVIRLIDVPGIGDTRGIDEDKRNMQKIIDHISFMDKIHGILIVLRPDQSRLTHQFAFCFTELLCHLHEDAAKNVHFVFTHSRTTKYNVGDSQVPLQACLDKIQAKRRKKELNLSLTAERMYFIDNEGFRHACARLCDYVFDDNVINDDSYSWSKSSQEIRRLFRNVTLESAHKVEKTVSLNRVKRLILNLREPMRKIQEFIEEKAREEDKRLLEIKTLKEKGKSLEDALYKNEFKYATKKLDKPTTECRHKECSKSVTKAKDDVSVMTSKSQCHVGCYLKGIPPSTLGDVRLKGCSAMNDAGICTRCGHEWNVHYHSLVEYVVTQERVIDENIQNSIQSNGSEEEKIKRVVDGLKKEIEEIKSDADKINEAWIKLGVFLSENAMTPFNYATVDLLKQQMAKEEQENGKSKRWEKLKNWLDEVVNEQKLFEELEEKGKRTQNSSNTPQEKRQNKSYFPKTPEEAQRIIDGLFKLKHGGKFLKDAVKEVEKAQIKHEGHERFLKYTPPNNEPSSRSLWKNIEKGFKNTFGFAA